MDVQRQSEKINTASFTPNLGTVCCSSACLSSIKGLVHGLFFLKVLYIWCSAFDSYLTCANENAPLKEQRWTRDSFIRALTLPSRVINTATSLGSASLIDYTVIINKRQQSGRPNKDLCLVQRSSCRPWGPSGFTPLKALIGLFRISANATLTMISFDMLINHQHCASTH